MIRRRCSPLSLTLAAAAGSCLAASAMADVEVLYSRAPNSPTAIVPGAVTLAGAPATPKFSSMLDFWLSPDGSRFLLRGASDMSSDEANYLMLGSGATGSLVLQEGQPFPGAVGSELVDSFSGFTTYPFNSNNDWAMALRARGGVSSVFNKLVRYQGMTGALRFQMGDLYTGLQDTGVSGDETLGNTQSSVHLLNDGRIGWQDNTVGNLSSTRRPVTVYDATKFLQSRLDEVTRIDNSGPILITNIGSTGTLSVFWTSPDGSRVVWRGAVDADLNGTNIPSDPDVVAVDGRVRIQENEVIPGTSITATAINGASVAANSDWYARGAFSGGAWAVRNGAIIAQTGDSIGADNWGSTFYTIAGNSSGDWVIAGKSSNADPEIDDVLVVNGQVILREGDGVSIDLDGNGTPETAFIGRGNNTLSAFAANNSVGIAPDGTVYIITYLHDSDGIDLAVSGTPYALVRITPDTVCLADFNNSGDVSVQDIFDFLAAYFANAPAADVNNSGGVTVQDIFDFLAAYFAGCP